jgi:EmrB/QacA subfamily drug resistance transporter
MKTMPRAQHTPPVGLALASLSLAMLLASLGTSSANVALPAVAQAFSASFQAVQWVVLAYLLATTTLIVSVGRLGDIVGRRRLLQVGFVLFAIASLLCGIAPTLWMLIAARTLQGLGAAILMTLALALARDAVPQHQTGRAMGLLGTTSAIGTALGPSLGGLLISALGWRAIFIVNVPLALVTLVLAWHALPADSGTVSMPQHAFDVRGTLLLAMTLGGYALAVTIGRGSFGALNLVLLTLAMAGLRLFVASQANAASPLVPVHQVREPVLRAGLMMSALVATVMMATLVVGPFYLARTLRLDAALAGLVMSVGPLVVVVTSVPAGRVVDHLGASWVTRLGLLAMLGGSLLLAIAPASFGVTGYVVPIALTTLGYAVFQTANTTLIMQDVSEDQRGVTSGLLNLSRNLGLMTGASVLGAVFSFAAGTMDMTIATPEAVGRGLRTTFAVAAVLIVIALGVAIMGRAPAVSETLPVGMPNT